MNIDKRSHHARLTQRYYEMLKGDEKDLRLRAEIHDIAWKYATADMLQEIHTMLRQLTKDEPPLKDWEAFQIDR